MPLLIVAVLAQGPAYVAYDETTVRCKATAGRVRITIPAGPAPGWNYARSVTTVGMIQTPGLQRLLDTDTVICYNIRNS